jgi:uncharacterized protein (DUF2249 family)
VFLGKSLVHKEEEFGGKKLESDESVWRLLITVQKRNKSLEQVVFRRTGCGLAKRLRSRIFQKLLQL